MSRLADQRAFPLSYGECVSSLGITFRQYAAVSAMQGLQGYMSPDGQTPPADVIATWAVKQADALIDELEKKR